MVLLWLSLGHLYKYWNYLTLSVSFHNWTRVIFSTFFKQLCWVKTLAAYSAFTVLLETDYFILTLITISLLQLEVPLFSRVYTPPQFMPPSSVYDGNNLLILQADVLAIGLMSRPCEYIGKALLSRNTSRSCNCKANIFFCVWLTR